MSGVTFMQGLGDLIKNKYISSVILSVILKDDVESGKSNSLQRKILYGIKKRIRYRTYQHS